mgnify:CR=1 FL=1
MNTNRNIPYNYNVKDIDWPGLKRQVVARQGVGNHPVETLYPGNQPDHGRYTQTGTR